jgi:hypothetical protein
VIRLQNANLAQGNRAESGTKYWLHKGDLICVQLAFGLKDSRYWICVSSSNARHLSYPITIPSYLMTQRHHRQSRSVQWIGAKQLLGEVALQCAGSEIFYCGYYRNCCSLYIKLRRRTSKYRSWFGPSEYNNGIRRP